MNPELRGALLEIPVIRPQESGKAQPGTAAPGGSQLYRTLTPARPPQCPGQTPLPPTSHSRPAPGAPLLSPQHPPPPPPAPACLPYLPRGPLPTADCRAALLGALLIGALPCFSPSLPPLSWCAGPRRWASPRQVLQEWGEPGTTRAGGGDAKRTSAWPGSRELWDRHRVRSGSTCLGWGWAVQRSAALPARPGLGSWLGRQALQAPTRRTVPLWPHICCICKMEPSQGPPHLRLAQDRAPQNVPAKLGPPNPWGMGCRGCALVPSTTWLGISSSTWEGGGPRGPRAWHMPPPAPAPGPPDPSPSVEGYGMGCQGLGRGGSFHGGQ